ncbi:P-loop containing nucleoside triphosphate hydrolase protein [Rhizophagus clarus]|uniref:P-loop containing nucleoside triphosphate hydrolase protein n=1 Tax=Rhizophagus clarus TaxID=94130 RepID=A0A8H3LQK4_9GLOM|nr:P-loop containing nucleoside triphosphate hydrolase protein [Rhizophagus clarus]
MDCYTLIVARFPNLTSLSVIDCLKLTNNFTRLNVTYCPRSITVNQPSKNLRNKNILIISHTGSGRSILANVLAGSEYFKESEHAVSETKAFNKREFKWNGINFRVVDTIGAVDTKLDLKRILYRIANGIYSMPEGISQVLFVVERFKSEEMNRFNMIKNIFLEIINPEYIILVRTKFNNFRFKEEYNPSINIDDDYDDCDDLIFLLNLTWAIREMTRKILLYYLENVFSIKESRHLKLKTCDKLRDTIQTIVNRDNEEISRIDPGLCLIL